MQTTIISKIKEGSTTKIYYLACLKNSPEVDPVLKSVAGPRFLLTTGLTLVNIGSPATLGFAFHPHKLLSNVQLSCFRSVTSVVGTEKNQKDSYNIGEN